MSARRVLAVTAITILGGALVGAALGAVMVSIDPGIYQTATLDAYLTGAAIMAGIGVVLGPIVGWGLIVNVPRLRTRVFPSLKSGTDFSSGMLVSVIYNFTGLTLIVLASIVRFRIEFDGRVGWVLPVVALGIGIMSRMAAQRLGTSYRRGQQALRDRRAVQTLNAVRNGEAPAFSLYLRSFEITARMPMIEDQFAGPLLAGDVRADVDTWSDVETQLAAGVEDEIPLIALGEPGEHPGAGRVRSTDETWQEDVRALANAAIVIFMFPSARAGTLWEARWLRDQRLLSRTIFVVPPRPGRLHRSDSYDWSVRWPEIRDAMMDVGVRLPDYEKKGQLFTVTADGSIVQTLLKGHYTRLALRSFIAHHLRKLARAPVPWAMHS